MTVVRLAGPCLLFALAACADRGTDVATGGTIVIGVPASWNPGPPAVIVDIVSRTVADQIYDRLAEIGPRLNTIGDAGFEPRLARRWTWAADSLSIAFEIDPVARWHDGRPVRAGDVRFTFDVVKDPKTGSSITAMLGNIDSVTTRDSLTAVAWYHRRTPEQFYDLVYQLQIIPEHLWKGVPRDKLANADEARAPVGSGRFRFVRFEPGVRLELIADTANYRGRAKLDRVVWAIVPDMGAAVTQLLTGQTDVLETVPADVIGRVDSSASLRAHKYENLQFSYLAFNLRNPKQPAAPHPLFGDRRVRRALSMALDRQAMLDNVFGAHGILGGGPFPRALSVGDSALALPLFDRRHAAALLDSAGWMLSPDGIRHRGGKALAFALIVPASSRARMRYAVLIQEQLKTMGVSVALESMEFPPFNDRQIGRQFDAALMSTGYDPSPATVRQAWSTSAITKGGQNFVSYSNPAFDALLDSALSTFDASLARARFRRAYEMLASDAPGVWLYDLPAVAGLHKRIRPVGMRADEWWANLADWWIPSNERIERDRIGLRPATP
jgi:peptide/nickel transport system substrate-binding protein